MPVNIACTPGIPASPGFPLRRCRPCGEEERQPQLCLLLRFCSVINSSGYSRLFKHPVFLPPYRGGGFPQHMLEFTASAAAPQSTFGFSHPQTAALIRGGFPSLSWGGQAQQLAFCRHPPTALGELPARGRGGSGARPSRRPRLPGLSERVTCAADEGQGAGVFISGGGGDLGAGLLGVGLPWVTHVLLPSETANLAAKRRDEINQQRAGVGARARTPSGVSLPRASKASAGPLRERGEWGHRSPSRRVCAAPKAFQARALRL